MKLYIVKSQDKLQARVELADDEAELVKQYKAEKDILLKKDIPLFGKRLSFELKIGHLIKGCTFKCGETAEIVATEEIIKEACANFKTYLEVMRNFGVEEIIDYEHADKNKGFLGI